MVTYKSEIDQKIIDLYLEGKTVREIAKIVHKSFSYICDIIRKYNERQARENLQGDSINSEETRAIELFSKGKTPLEVKVELNISTEETEVYYKDYWKLSGLHQLYEYYETEIKNDLPSFLKLYSEAKKLGISDDELMIALHYLNDLSYLALKIGFLRKIVRNLAARKKRLISELTELESSINKFRNSFEQI
ncbi:MAG: helix-turn-helix domain-containing protein [Candidatus Nitrosocosmicus sp.]